jgi:hypothetical protein
VLLQHACTCMHMLLLMNAPAAPAGFRRANPDRCAGLCRDIVDALIASPSQDC